ncbi:MAG: hypothetical protein GY810_11905 [Aureispira sp.]|nr:hypothetical protein [Aureispira sp.]
MRLIVIICCISIFCGNSVKAIESISIITNNDNLLNTISELAIKDCISLLEQACNCRVELNDSEAEILLTLPQIDPNNEYAQSKSTNYPSLKYPQHYYTWQSERVKRQVVLSLETPSYVGISNGLYGLLQEQLWFSFYHPRKTIIPDLLYWPLTESFEWNANPRFEKKGFHLHTMHPLELTEQLMDASFENGQEDIKEYINWLARNQQNYFEFNLLEGVDRETWIDYIKPVVQYGKDRGILMGVDLSLHMIQQKAFMLYKNFPASWASKKKQIKKNLEWLFEAKWDVINMEFSTTEFTAGNVQQKQKLQLYITDEISNTYEAKLMGREHVVSPDNKLANNPKERAYEYTEEERLLDKARGTLIHTVMFYTISEDKAPVYGNTNLQHMLDQLHKQQPQRETWYYPESAYWITFDNSVPMTHLPYLSARLDDIQLMDSLNVEGHITFSSGWEWGYWLVDWSIARWSWEHSFNGQKRKNRPTQYLGDIFKGGIKEASLINQALELQQEYIKDRELIKYMAPFTVTDELPEKLRLHLQPRPDRSYKWLRKKSADGDLAILKKQVIEPLEEFASKTAKIVEGLKKLKHKETEEQKIFQELTNGIAITGLRAQHKANTLAYLVSKRNAKLNGGNKNGDNTKLEKAQAIRQEAQLLVNAQEANYRYPKELLAREFLSHTAYNYGYLYPVSKLHFWEREEEQIRQDKYGLFFMSIWDIPRIMGIVD